MTRLKKAPAALLATVLDRAAGSPTVYGSSGFLNMRPGPWYSDPVTQEQLMVLPARFQGGDAAWTGNPALAAVVARAQVAQASEQARITRTQTLVIAKQGMFSAGGIVTESVGGA